MSRRMTTNDPYEVLGLQPGAPVEDVRAAYRRLAQRYHPDRHSGAADHVRVAAEMRMKDLNVAYDAIISGRYRPPAGVANDVRRVADAGRAAWTDFSDSMHSEWTPGVPRPPSLRRQAREMWDAIRGSESSLPPLSVEEVAARLRVSPRVVYRLLERGVLQGVRVGGLWRIPLDALSRYLVGWEARSRGRGRNDTRT